MLEEVASKVWAAHGGMVALELPSKRDVSDGAIRFSFDTGSDWQAQISDLMLRAERLCVVLDGTEGVLWELDELVRLDLLNKTTVVFPASFSIQNAEQKTRNSLEDKLGFGVASTDHNSRFPLVWFMDSMGRKSVVEMHNQRRDSYEAALLIASNQLGGGNLLKFPGARKVRRLRN